MKYEMLALPLWFLTTQTQHQQSNCNMELMRLIRGAFTVSPSIAADDNGTVELLLAEGFVQKACENEQKITQYLCRFVTH